MTLRPLIIGIDPATTTGICEGRAGSTPTLLAQRFRGDTHEDIFGEATLFFATFLKDRTPDLIAIEAPLIITTGRTTAQVVSVKIGLHAIFTGIAKCKGIPLKVVQVSTWRKYALGRGNLPGPEAKRASLKLCSQLGWDAASSHDAAEAAMIWLWASAQIAPQSVQRAEPLFIGAQA